MQPNFILSRGGILTAAVLLGALAANANANPTGPRLEARPGAVRPEATTKPSPTPKPSATPKPADEQVLLEGGTLAANYFGNLADIQGTPITCASIPADYRDCASESSIPATPVPTIQFLYAAVGTGGAQLDFVDEASGKAAKSASAYPESSDAFDAYSNTSPYGYKEYDGTGPTPGPTGTPAAEEDSLDAAAGDAPIPLGPKEGTDFVPKAFTIYADSIAAFDNGGSTTGSDQTGAGYNPNRGPAKVVPVIGTGVRIIFNTTGLTLNSNGSLNLTQDDLCGIMTGQYTDWNQTAADPLPAGGSQPITIIHRSDGSGTTFLTAYDLSQMCSGANPLTIAGKPASGEYWNQVGLTQGVGTDSGVLSSSGVVPTDASAPEVVWPNNSIGASKSAGMLNAVSTTTGGVGYVTPSDVLLANTAEAYIQNYNNSAQTFEQADATSVAASLAGTSSGDTNPPGYPVDNKKTTLYFPFPTATTGDALVGYSYGYFYTCYPTRLKDQATEVEDFFKYESTSKTAPTAATVATFWNLNALSSTLLSDLSSALSFKTAPVTTATAYTSPVNGATEDYKCTDL